MPLLICSNSCPRWDDGRLLPRSPGGLVPMVIALLARHGGQWIFTAPLERPDACSTRLEEGDIWLHPIPLAEEVRQQHYDTISIALFLRLLHYMHDTSAEPVFDDAILGAWEAYEGVNRVYARRLAELTRNTRDEWILVNDPHLMLVPGFLAEDSPARNSR